MVAKACGFDDDRTGLGAEHREATVHDDAIVGGDPHHRTGLDDDFIRYADGVGPRQGLGT